MAKILFLTTAADHWTLADGFEQPSGFWAEEAIGPYGVFKKAGYEIAAATPGSVPPTADALSLTPDFNGGRGGCRADEGRSARGHREIQNGLADRAQWLLQDRLVADVGADYHKGEENFAPHIEVDRTLITGQNPASAVPLAQKVVKALG